MKRMICVLILVCMSTSSTMALEQDKVKHVAASTAISGGIITATNNVWLGVGSCMGVGLLKEGYDNIQEGNKFDMEDMVANGVGCALGIPIGKTGNRIFFDGKSIGYKINF